MPDSKRGDVQLAGATENEADKQLGTSDRTPIFVDELAPATLRYSETSVNYLTLREARTAWLALHPEVKKEASITTGENGGAAYRGWEIYRLWAR